MIRKIAKRKKEEKKKSRFGVLSGPEDSWMKPALIPGAVGSAAATGLGVIGSVKKWRAKRAGKSISPRWAKAMKIEKPMGRAALALAIPLLSYKAYKVWQRMKAEDKKGK